MKTITGHSVVVVHRDKEYLYGYLKHNPFRPFCWEGCRCLNGPHDLAPEFKEGQHITTNNKLKGEILKIINERMIGYYIEDGTAYAVSWDTAGKAYCPPLDIFLPCVWPYWDKYPNYNYLAKDFNGDWFLFAGRPVFDSCRNHWYEGKIKGWKRCPFEHYPNADKDTLLERP
jgi:hypothetical protein